MNATNNVNNAKIMPKYANIERPHATIYVLAIAKFALSVTICKIIFDIKNEGQGR